MRTQLIACLIGLLAAAPAAHAGSCHIVKQQVVVKEVAAVQVATVAVLPVALIPAAVYTVGAAYPAVHAPQIVAPHAPPQQQPQAAVYPYGQTGPAVPDKLDLILQKLEATERRLAALEGGGQPRQLQQKTDPNRPPVASICYACHAPAKAADKGGQLSLFVETDGKAFPVKLPSSMARVLKEAIVKGTMPPPEHGVRLTEEQKAEALKSFGIE